MVNAVAVFLSIVPSKCGTAVVTGSNGVTPGITGDSVTSILTVLEFDGLSVTMEMVGVPEILLVTENQIGT